MTWGKVPLIGIGSVFFVEHASDGSLDGVGKFADLQKPGSDTQKQADTDNADHCGHTPDKVIYYIVDLFYRL